MSEFLKSVWIKLRPILAPRLDIPFARDDANRFLPWFIALMVFLTATFLAIGITVGDVLQHKRQNVSEWVTVQVPASENSAVYSDRVVGVLEAESAIGKVKQRSKQETMQLGAPWFGEGDAVRQLPLPTVIEAHITDLSSFDSAALAAKLREISSDLEISDHAHWIEHYLNFIFALEVGAYFLAFLVLSAACVMIIFTSKTALKLHQDAVWLLHSVGAMDHYIARQFQFNAFLLGMRGALIGTTLAATLFFVLAFFTSQFDAPLLPALPVNGWHLAVWLALPPLTGVLAMMVAHKTVLAMLQRIA
jgi:cell division transport system permease protein